MKEKVRRFCEKKRMRSIRIDADAKACINCIWYQQYYQRGFYETFIWEPTDTGYCLLRAEKKSPLCEGCKDFDWEAEP